MSVNPSNILVSSIKKSEIGDDLIIRCVETNGVKTKATLRLPADGETWTGDFAACEIKTLRYNYKTGKIKEVDLLEE